MLTFLFADKEEAEKLFMKVEDACRLLAEYNGRLQAELDERKQVAIMLHHFIVMQKNAVITTEGQLEVLSKLLLVLSDNTQQ